MLPHKKVMDYQEHSPVTTVTSGAVGEGHTTGVVTGVGRLLTVCVCVCACYPGHSRQYDLVQVSPNNSLLSVHDDEPFVCLMDKPCKHHMRQFMHTSCGPQEELVVSPWLPSITQYHLRHLPNQGYTNFLSVVMPASNMEAISS